MSGAIHLQNRLDGQDIEHMFALSHEGVTSKEIGRRYRVSAASMNRILSGSWSEPQIAAWGDPLTYPFRREGGTAPFPKARQLTNEQKQHKSESHLLTLIQDRKELEDMLADNAKQLGRLLGLTS